MTPDVLDTPPPQAGSGRRWLWVSLTAALVVVVAVGVAVAVWATRDTRPPEPTGKLITVLEQAKDHCAVVVDAVDVADAGRTLLVDGSGRTSFGGADPSVWACILTELQAPQAVTAHMDSTRALDGRQESSWPGFTASWTYHPDSGLDGIIRMA